MLGPRQSLRRVVHRGNAFLATEKPCVTPNVIYMDYQATTPLDCRVLNAMMPSLKEHFGNAHSRTHSYGWKAETITEDARKHIANLINAEPREIIFTSGATESNNLALKGVCEFYGKTRGKKHLITVETEHKCVLATTQYLKNERGWDVTYLKVDRNGIIDLAELEAAIRPDTVVISVMTVNNEIGVIQPIKQIAAIGHKHGVFVHTDAAQAVGKIPIDVKELDVDLMSISAHKIYGPKGIGALYIRSKPKVRVAPLIHGGDQERGLRSGTLPVPLCVGFGEAAKIAKEEMGKNLAHIENLSKRFLSKIMSSLDAVALNGHEYARFPGNCNLSFDCVEGESLIMAMKNVAVSSGSACTSASLEPSYVLRALGVEEDVAHTSIRFGFGKDTTEAEVDEVADTVIKCVNELRELSPLWEIKKSGSNENMVWT